MSNKKVYRIDEVCKELNVSVHTLQKWYQWESRSLIEGTITERYLPVPEKLMNERGKPKIWTSSQIKELKKYASSIVVGRNGKYGRYTNPLHKQTKRYQEEIENGNPNP